MGIWPHDHPHGAGRIGLHSKENGGLCPHSQTAITYAAAVARDNQLNPQEQAAYSVTWQHLNACRGPRFNDECTAPICHQRAVKGLVWTLMGWKPEPDLALF